MIILPEMSWSWRSISPEHIEKIISGGHTGVDRTALMAVWSWAFHRQRRPKYGADAMVYLCAMCFATLNKKAREVEMNNYMVSNIWRLALGETLPKGKPL